MVTQKEAGIPGTAGVVQEGMVAEVQIGAAEKAELPAFLERDELGEYKLPEGYESVSLLPEGEQLIQLGAIEGSETVCYVGRVGVRLRRAAEGKVFFSLLGFDLPKNIDPHRGDESYVSLGNIGPDGIPLVEDELAIYLYPSGYLSGSSSGVEGWGSWRSVGLNLPWTDDELGFGYFGPVFRVEKGDITIENRSGIDDTKIVVPKAMAGEGQTEMEAARWAAREEARRKVEAVLAVPEKPAEVELTFTERVFVVQLEDLVKLEEVVAGLDPGQLQKHFEGMKSWFPKLSAGGRLRQEVMKNVFGQLGVKAEKLRGAGKTDEQIFEEWLKRVFIPLYRRTVKK